LLALGFAFEQTVQPRRAPARTPPLEEGRAPQPIAFEVAAQGSVAALAARFTWDVTTHSLGYDLTVSSIRADEIHGVNLHRITLDAATDGLTAGGVVHHLSGPGVSQGAGAVTLTSNERAALLDGRLYVSVYTADEPAGGGKSRLLMPAPAPGPN
jgi:hypothetical protein